jgi:hypothetical protein
LKRTIRVKGGAGARAGDLPDGATEISESDLVSGFQISALFPADAAELRDGLLFILGGGWTKYRVPKLPQETVWQVICTANRNAQLNSSAARWLQLCVLDPQGVEVSRIALELPEHALSSTNFHWLVPIGAQLNATGLWTIRVQSGGFLLSQIGVNVELSQ